MNPDRMETAAAGRPRGNHWNLVVALLGALAVRVLYSCLAYSTTFDSAVVGCMAIRILREGERPLFFYGQKYFGSLEAWLAAGIFALAGIGEFTLSLAAILPSLGWIAATWWLLQRWAGPRAAAVAIWPLVVPGWVVLHYSVATYGGYPIAFLLGTLVLALSLRVFERDLIGLSLLPYSSAIALTAGLAMWTHFLSATYLLPAAFLIMIAGIRRRLAWCWLWPWFAALPMLGCSLSPLFLELDVIDLAKVARWTPSVSAIAHNAVALLQRPLRDQFLYPHAATAHRFVGRCLFAATMLAPVLSLAIEPNRRLRRRLLAPLSILVVFLAFYLPHPMASLKVSRYVIPFWTVGLMWALAVPVASSNSRLRTFGAALTVGWTVYQGLGIAAEMPFSVRRRSAQLIERQSVVEAARAAGLRSATVVGSSLIGHQGSIFTLASHCQIVFVNPWDERHRRSADVAEADDASGFLVAREYSGRIRAALRDLGATWSEATAARHIVFYRVHAPPTTSRGIPRAAMTVRASDGSQLAALIDRSLQTTFDAPYGSNCWIEIELNDAFNVDAVHLVPREPHGIGLPRDFIVDVSMNGAEWRTVRHSAPRTALAWTAGPRVFLYGYGGHLECRWPATTARYLRITLLPTPGVSPASWSLAELYLCAADPRSELSSPDVRVVADALRQTSPPTAFVAADRWLSAHLAHLLESPRVFPRPNPRYRNRSLDRRLRGNDIIVATADAWADEAWEVANSSGYEVSELGRAGGYTLLQILGGREGASHHPLLWEGTFLLREI